MKKYPRVESPLNFYHVTCRGNNKSFIFDTDDEKQYYLHCVWNNIVDLKIDLAAYCVMSNHVHLLIGCDLKQLSVFMQAVNDGFAKYYNLKHAHIGHVFEGTFYSSPITSDEYFIECIRYIHQNPVKANICAVDKYRWSSYRNYLYHQGPVAWEKGSILIGDTEAYIHFMDQNVTERYSFFSSEDLYFSDEEARDYMCDYMRKNNYPLPPDIPFTKRRKLVCYFYEHNISVHQISQFLGLNRRTIHRDLQPSSPRKTN